MRDWKPGEVLEVVDDKPRKPGDRKLPFRKGQAVVVANVHPTAGVGLVKFGGWWGYERFEVRRG
jgi:hypothetical protein